MTKEIKMIGGVCSCNHKLDIRLWDCRTDKTPEPVTMWTIHGVCNKCKLVIMQALFVQAEEPIEDVDFIIDWNKRVVLIDK